LWPPNPSGGHEHLANGRRPCARCLIETVRFNDRRRVPYLSSLRLGKEELIQSIGISAFVCPLALGLALAVSGEFHAAIAGTSFLALLPALAGMYAGQHVRGRLQPAVFRRWFFIGLIALGGHMIFRSLRFP